MASLEPSVPPARRDVPAPDGASNAGPLTPDGLYEVLLHLPAKELCRLRAVCRSWRSLISGPHFAVAHAARHPEPLFLASYANSTGCDRLVDILDVSGRILKRVRREEDEVVVSMSLDLVCVKTIEGGSFWLRNLINGSVYHLPNELAEEHLAHGFKLCDYREPVYLFGKVANTGRYKVLRMLPCRRDPCKNLFEVCTVSRTSPVQWRVTQGPIECFLWQKCARVVIGGVVYLLTLDALFAVVNPQDTEQNWLVSFDLEAEEWGPSIKGPSSLAHDARLNGYLSPLSKQFSLANLNDSLVIVHGPNPCMDLWFLVDSKKGLWLKNYSVQIERYEHILPIHPLVLFDDGRIILRFMDLLLIHDSRANTFSNLMNPSHLSEINLYTGNLLSLDAEN